MQASLGHETEPSWRGEAGNSLIFLKAEGQWLLKLPPIKSSGPENLSTSVFSYSRHGVGLRSGRPPFPRGEGQEQEPVIWLLRWCQLGMSILSQRLGGIDPCDPERRRSGCNQGYRFERQDDDEDGGNIVDAYSIEHTAHSAQRSCT
jgi:hypothetical protein